MRILGKLYSDFASNKRTGSKRAKLLKQAFGVELCTFAEVIQERIEIIAILFWDILSEVRVYKQRQAAFLVFNREQDDNTRTGQNPAGHFRSVFECAEPRLMDFVHAVEPIVQYLFSV